MADREPFFGPPSALAVEEMVEELGVEADRVGVEERGRCLVMGVRGRGWARRERRERENIEGGDERKEIKK